MFTLNAQYYPCLPGYADRRDRMVALAESVKVRTEWKYDNGPIHGPMGRMYAYRLIDLVGAPYNHSAWENRKVKASWAPIFAAAHTDGDQSPVIQFLHDHMVTPSIARYLETHGLIQCSDCGEVFNADEGVHSETYNGLVCDDCQSHHVLIDEAYYDRDDSDVIEAQSSRNNSTYVLRDDVRETVDGNTYTEAYAERLGYYWQNDDGLWVDHDPDENEEEEYGDHIGRASYHGHPLRNGGYFDETSERSNPAIGFELETYCEQSISETLENWIVESDASLDSRFGQEIVSKPRLLTYWQERIPDFSSDLIGIGAEAWNAEGGQYGMHVSVHRRHLSALQESRIGLFLSCAENTDFIRAIAQRKDVYSASLSIGEIAESNLKKFSAIKGKGKFAPFYQKTDRWGAPSVFEVRIFQATLKAERILKNIEFVHALVRWTDTKSATGSEYRHGAFLTWLSSHKADYPNLVAYLRQDTFAIKGASKIARNWEV